MLPLLRSVNCLQSSKVGESIEKKIRHNRKCGYHRNRPLPAPEPRGLAPERGKSSLGWPGLTPGMRPPLKWGAGVGSHRQREHSSAPVWKAGPLLAAPCGHRAFPGQEEKGPRRQEFAGL